MCCCILFLTFCWVLRCKFVWSLDRLPCTQQFWSCSCCCMGICLCVGSCKEVGEINGSDTLIELGIQISLKKFKNIHIQQYTTLQYTIRPQLISLLCNVNQSRLHYNAETGTVRVAVAEGTPPRITHTRYGTALRCSLKAVFYLSHTFEVSLTLLTCKLKSSCRPHLCFNLYEMHLQNEKFNYCATSFSDIVLRKRKATSTTCCTLPKPFYFATLSPTALISR